MNTEETTLPSSQPERELQSLQQQLAGLRNLFIAALVVLLVFSGSINLYLLRQVITVRKELSANRPTVHQLVENYKKNEGPAIEGFIKSLQAFAQQHPDFVPVLAKYGLAPASQGAGIPTAPPQTP